MGRDLPCPPAALPKFQSWVDRALPKGRKGAQRGVRQTGRKTPSNLRKEQGGRGRDSPDPKPGSTPGQGRSAAPPRSLLTTRTQNLHRPPPHPRPCTCGVICSGPGRTGCGRGRGLLTGWLRAASQRLAQSPGRPGRHRLLSAPRCCHTQLRCPHFVPQPWR